MLSAKDFAEHGPDERAVILYVAFLCSRLLECSKDDRAAHIIQTTWRQAKAKTAGGCKCGCRDLVLCDSAFVDSVVFPSLLLSSRMYHKPGMAARCKSLR
jgi:hypothetical protein